MSQLSITFDKASLSYQSKQLFQGFSHKLYLDKKVVIVGPNGSGKSSLLKMLAKKVEPSSGYIKVPDSLNVILLEQNNCMQGLSGGQGFNTALSICIAQKPDLLLLDEPSNHLDYKNKRSLIGFASRAKHGIIVATHDVDLIAGGDFDQIWEIYNEEITVYNCSWDEFSKQKEQGRKNLYEKVQTLDKEKQKLKKAIETARQKASSRKRSNKNENDKILLGMMKESGEQTSSKKLGRINKNLQENSTLRSELFIAKEFLPKFNIDSSIIKHKTLVEIRQGEAWYKTNPESKILKGANFLLTGQQKLLLSGNNGSGKTTLLKAILQNPEVATSGQWTLPVKNSIAYLDQHYQGLDDHNTVFDEVKLARPDWTNLEIQKHLVAFLFVKPNSWTTLVKNLSGGERARLSLAKIGAKTPSLLILDEPSNNLDMQTKEYLAKVIGTYPGAIIMVCHEESFINQTGVLWSVEKLP